MGQIFDWDVLGLLVTHQWDVAGDKRWALLVGFGFSKRTILGGTHWKFRLRYWQFVKQLNSLGPDFQVRFSFGPVVPLPWQGRALSRATCRRLSR